MSQRLAMPGGKRFARKLNLTPKLLVAMQLWDTVRAQASGMCKLMLSDRSQFPIGFFFHFTVFHFQWGGVYPVSIRHSGHFESTVHAWRLPRHWEYWPQVLLFILTADTHTDYGGGPNVSMFFTRFEDPSPPSCGFCHIPYDELNMPFPAQLTYCYHCRRQKVHCITSYNPFILLNMLV